MQAFLGILGDTCRILGGVRTKVAQTHCIINSDDSSTWSVLSALYPWLCRVLMITVCDMNYSPFLLMKLRLCISIKSSLIYLFLSFSLSLTVSRSASLTHTSHSLFNSPGKAAGCTFKEIPSLPTSVFPYFILVLSMVTSCLDYHSSLQSGHPSAQSVSHI